MTQSLLFWSNNFWHCFDTDGELVASGEDYLQDDPLERFPEATLYLSVPECEVDTVKAKDYD